MFPGFTVSGFPRFFTYSAKPCPSMPALPERGISRGRLRGVISRKERMLRLVCVTHCQVPGRNQIRKARISHLR